MIGRARTTLAAARAREVLHDLRLENPSEIDPEEIAFIKGVAVQQEPLSGMDGNIVREQDRAIITVNSQLKYPRQKRFVIAHELGHYFLHPKTRQFDPVQAEQAANWSEKQEVEEFEANVFAAELLMPNCMFAPRCNGVEPSLDYIEQLADDYQTTLTSTAVQFVLNTKEECLLVASADRYRSWFIQSPGFSFSLLEDSYIHGHSCTAKVNGKRPKSRSSQIEASFWLQSFRENHEAYITEDARYFSTIQRALSLLWIHDVI